MHTRLILPGEIIDVLSEDKKSPEENSLAGCRDITYIAKNTTKQGIIFWDQPDQNNHILQSFVASSNSDDTYFHKIEYHTQPDQAQRTFNEMHDYLRVALGQIHHVQSKIVRDHSQDKTEPKGTPIYSQACSIITRTKEDQHFRITRYLRELQHNEQFLIAVTAIPLQTINQPLYQKSSQEPLQSVKIKLFDGPKAMAAAHANEIANQYFCN